MVLLKTDDRGRLKLPDVKPGQVLICEKAAEGRFVLRLVKKSEPEQPRDVKPH